MVLHVYGFEASPPCRGVLLAMRALGLEYTLKPINIKAGDNRTPEYLQMNPQHTVPVLDDDGFQLAESRAIVTYLANKYAPDNSLYPKDPTARARVDSRLYFDHGFFSNLILVLRPLIYKNDLERSNDGIPLVIENLQILEAMLGKSEYAAGRHVTFADLALVATVSTIEAMGLDLSDVPKVRAWLAKLKELPFYEVNIKGVTGLGAMYKQLKASCEGNGQ